MSENNEIIQNKKNLIQKKNTNKVENILSKDYMVKLDGDEKILCDICEKLESDIYLDKNEKILICLKCIKNLIN